MSRVAADMPTRNRRLRGARDTRPNRDGNTKSVICHMTLPPFRHLFVSIESLLSDLSFESIIIFYCRTILAHTPSTRGKCSKPINNLFLFTRHQSCKNVNRSTARFLFIAVAIGRLHNDIDGSSAQPMMWNYCRVFPFASDRPNACGATNNDCQTLHIIYIRSSN